MARISRSLLAPLVIAGTLAAANATHAGPLENWFGVGGYGDCPRPSYSPLNYWTPLAVRLHDYFHGPCLPMYAFDLHPEIPRPDYILKYTCQYALPAATVVPVPKAPDTSRFRY